MVSPKTEFDSQTQVDMAAPTQKASQARTPPEHSHKGSVKELHAQEAAVLNGAVVEDGPGLVIHPNPALLALYAAAADARGRPLAHMHPIIAAAPAQARAGLALERGEHDCKAQPSP